MGTEMMGVVGLVGGSVAFVGGLWLVLTGREGPGILVLLGTILAEGLLVVFLMMKRGAILAPGGGVGETLAALTEDSPATVVLVIVAVLFVFWASSAGRS